MKRILLFLALSLAASGCSDSTSAKKQTYPLQLATVGYTKTGQIGAFTLQVSKSGTVELIKGAKLTVLTYPQGKLDTVAVNSVDIVSDSIGNFEFAYDWGASTSLAFQAVKDTSVSNYVRF